MQKLDRKKMKTIVLVITTIVPFLLWGAINIDPVVLIDNQPILLWVHVPSTVQSSETAEFIVEAWDQFERISAVYSGTVSFSLRSYNLTSLETIPAADVEADLPSEYQFTGQLIQQCIIPAWLLWGGDNGVHSFTFSISTEGVHYVVVNDSHTQKTYWSNRSL